MNSLEYMLMMMVGTIIFFEGLADGRAAYIILKAGGEVPSMFFNVYMPVGLSVLAAVTITLAVWSLIHKKD